MILIDETVMKTIGVDHQTPVNRKSKKGETNGT